MFKDNIFDLQVRKIYYVITKIFQQHPLWWEVFVEDIVNNEKTTFINDTTMIISIYELPVSKVIILFNVLKELKRHDLLTKIINKREFLIIHINDKVVLDYLISTTKWINLIVYKMLNETFLENKIYLKDEIIFVDDKRILYLITDPTHKYISDQKHQYIYLYKNKYIKHLGFIENHLKYYSNKTIFIEKFKEYLSK